uniref:Pleckstrin homology domain containing, family A member 7a n=1 Tax=Cyprinus carpio TaxID=7962 RepID=A0A8C2D7A5_CYPCA
IMAAPLRRDTLPENYSYGVCRDGRVFFIDDETRSTSWLHPCTGEPVNSGHMIRSDLPTCWEEGFTKEGASFFIDHNQRTTTFIHPVTGQISAENSDFRLQDQTGQHMLKQQPQSTTRPSSTISEASTAVTSSTLDTTSGSKGSKSSGRVHSFGKRDHAIKRNPSVPAVVRGWLYKQDSSGMRLWKRKWFVLADYCLFYYKDSREESVLGSIPLPSYTIAPVGPEDHISRKYAFKATHTGMRSYIYKQSSVIGSQAEHTGMRTYYFSADTQEDMTGWVRAMNQAALINSAMKSEFVSTDGTIPRQTPSIHPKYGTIDKYQSLPKTVRQSPPTAHRQLSSEYKYSHDRLNHFQMTHGHSQRPATHDKTVWQLYEWQQRQQYRHGSPTAPVYTPAPDYSTAVSSTRVNSGVARSISVPPTLADIPPPGPPGPRLLSLRRPHTPAERVTVKPLEDRPTVEVPPSNSPHHRRSYKVSGTETLKGRPAKPVKVAESDVDVTLSRLCEQDKILQELEFRLSGLKDDKDKLESVLDVSHQQMEQYKDQPAHAEKIAYQQRLLQEDLVHIRADISRVSTEMERAWEDYSRLEQSVEQLRDVLLLNRCVFFSQEKNQLRRELWRIEDVITGLSSSKETFKITIDSVKNPERKLVPSVIESTVPSRCMTPSVVEVRSPQRSLTSSPLSLQMYIEDLLHTHSEEDDAPPRPPLPLLYDEDTPPVVPPLPKETSVIRHTSVRGLKRQSDERKRDRESSYVNGEYRVELRSYLSEPELPGAGTDQVDAGYLTLQRRGEMLLQLLIIQVIFKTHDAFSGKMQFNRPKSALERLCSVESQPDHPPQRGRMSVEEQLERMKRHQRALVRERKRNLSQGERQPVGSRTSTRPVSSDPGSVRYSLPNKHRDPRYDEWLTVEARPMNAQELEPEVEPLCTPQKVSIPERLMDVELDEDLSPEEKETRSRTVAKIKSLLSKSSGNSMDVEHTDFSELDEEQQQQERIMSIHRALATEASIKRKQVTGETLSSISENIII